MKKHLAMVTLATGLATFEAGAASVSLDQLVGCVAIADASARLACYDREVAPLARQAGGATRSGGAPAVAAPPAAAPASPPPAPVPAPVVRAPAPVATPTPVVAPPSFGKEQLSPEQRPAPAPEERLMHALLTSQRPAGGGMFNLYLDNGQVWRHQDLVQGPFLRDGDAITIEKGALGSYKLSRDAGKSRNWIRVTRVR